MIEPSHIICDSCLDAGSANYYCLLENMEHPNNVCTCSLKVALVANG